MFVLTKDKWDFSFAQTVQDCVGLLKVSGKNVFWSTPLMKHAHEIKVCVFPSMFRMYASKEESGGRGGGRGEKKEQTERGMPLCSPVYRYVFGTLEVGVN